MYILRNDASPRQCSQAGFPDWHVKSVGVDELGLRQDSQAGAPNWHVKAVGVDELGPGTGKVLHEEFIVLCVLPGKGLEMVVISEHVVYGQNIQLFPLRLQVPGGYSIFMIVNYSIWIVVFPLLAEQSF